LIRSSKYSFLHSHVDHHAEMPNMSNWNICDMKISNLRLKVFRRDKYLKWKVLNRKHQLLSFNFTFSELKTSQKVLTACNVRLCMVLYISCILIFYGLKQLEDTVLLYVSLEHTDLPCVDWCTENIRKPLALHAQALFPFTA